MELANRLAPEHLELQVRDPEALLARVRHAGASSSARHTPEVVGDYVAGPNHVLPTAGTARFASPLGTEDFVKRLERDRVLGRRASRRRCRTSGRWRGSKDSTPTRGAAVRIAAARDARTMTGQQERGARAEPPAGRVERKTKETEIAVQLNIDGTGGLEGQTPIPFFSHMLEAWSKHGLMDLAVEATGDVEVDIHHTVEDVGICSGQALREALGDKSGIVRYGTPFVPMDEALLQAAVDLSGRPFLVFNVPVERTRIANFDLDMLQEFFRAFAVNAEITLHVTMHYGENLHHIAEAVFKAVGRALAEATAAQPADRRRA